MDTGRPPPMALSQEAHAGCLSFELSWKQHRLVINCGLPAVNQRELAAGRARHRGAFDCDLQRAAPHAAFSSPVRSAACWPARRSSPVRTCAGSSARDTAERRPAPGCRMTATPVIAASSITAPSDSAPTASRARRRGQLHTVRWRGISARHGRRISPSASTCIPAVKASRLSDGRGVILLLPDREVWTFATWPTRSRSRKACSWPAPMARAAPCRS